MRNDDRSYFVQRAMEERKAAERAVCPHAAAAHRELAERYAAMISNKLVKRGLSSDAPS